MDDIVNRARVGGVEREVFELVGVFTVQVDEEGRVDHGYRVDTGGGLTVKDVEVVRHTLVVPTWCHTCVERSW